MKELLKAKWKIYYFLLGRKLWLFASSTILCMLILVWLLMVAVSCIEDGNCQTVVVCFWNGSMSPGVGLLLCALFSISKAHAFFIDRLPVGLSPLSA